MLTCATPNLQNPINCLWHNGLKFVLNSLKHLHFVVFIQFSTSRLVCLDYLSCLKKLVFSILLTPSVLSFKFYFSDKTNYKTILIFNKLLILILVFIQNIIFWGKIIILVFFDPHPFILMAFRFHLTQIKFAFLKKRKK